MQVRAWATPASAVAATVAETAGDLQRVAAIPRVGVQGLGAAVVPGPALSGLPLFPRPGSGASARASGTVCARAPREGFDELIHNLIDTNAGTERVSAVHATA